MRLGVVRQAAVLDLRSVALWKMEGHTNADVAARPGRVARGVERRPRIIGAARDKEGQP